MKSCENLDFESVICTDVYFVIESPLTISRGTSDVFRIGVVSSRRLKLIKRNENFDFEVSVTIIFDDNVRI